MEIFINAKGLTEKQITAFFKKVEKVENGCWLWIGNCQKIGYGKFLVNGKTCLAHRISYELFKGKIPEKLKLDHFYCKTRNCVNPDHVEPVTQKTNVLRGNSFSSINAVKTHCPKNHPYDETNTRIAPLKNGNLTRRCKTCERLKRQAKYKLAS